MENSAIRDTILQNLKKESGFESMAVVEIDGNHFAAVDIAVQDGDGNTETYRIAVTRHNAEAIEG